MDTLFLVLIIVAAIAVVLFLVLGKGKGKGSEGSDEFPYRLRDDLLLTKAERSFYGVLAQAVGTNWLIFAKVRVADVLATKKGLNSSDRQRALNAILAKHFDFVICDPTDCSAKLAIELDDSSHNSVKAQKRDNLVNGACKAAGLPLLRIKAAKGYVVADIRRQVQDALGLQEEAPTPAPAVQEPVSESAVAESTSTNAPAQTSVSAPSPNSEGTNPESAVERKVPSKSPACPKCGEPMVRRKAKSGRNAGQVFWGCSAFPKCRTVAKIRA